MRYSAAERERKVARIWEPLQQGARPIRRLRRPGVRFTEDGTRQGRCVVVRVSTARGIQHRLLRALLVRRRVIVVSVPSRQRLYSVVRATTQRFGASREKYRIRQRAYGNVVERTMGGVP